MLYTSVLVPCSALADPNSLPRPSKVVALNPFNPNGVFSRAEDIEEPYPYDSEHPEGGGPGLFSEGSYVQSLTITTAEGGRYAGSFSRVNMLDGSGKPAYGTLSGTFDARVCP